MVAPIQEKINKNLGKLTTNTHSNFYIYMKGLGKTLKSIDNLFSGEIIMTEEIMVKDIPGYEGLYQVTSDGRIFSKKRAKFLKTDDNGNGYKFVFLYKNNVREKVYIHRVVAEAFCEKADENYNEILITMPQVT